MTDSPRHPASFRDPSGYVFFRDGRIYRQVNRVYQQHFDHLISSGLYEKLASEGLLIRHTEADVESLDPESCYKVIAPEAIPFISYPYEWCFSQLKKAALLSLDIARISLEHGMVLKDASAFNVQFVGTQPVFIDTLSFEIYKEGEPWIAYRQFCEHFLAPLLLMSYASPDLNRMLAQFIDGIPVEIAASLLPRKTRFKPSVYMHVFAHARAKESAAEPPKRKARVSRTQLLALIDNLKNTVLSLELKRGSSVWSNYYQETNYTELGFEHKIALVKEFLDMVNPEHRLIDIGANTGVFSRLAAEKCYTLSVESDPLAAEINFNEASRHSPENLLTLVVDVTNPTPSVGWMNEERSSFLERARGADAVLFLAVLHHLAIGNNLPLDSIAHFLSELAPWCLVEFVPKEDSQVQRMLATREDIFKDYHVEGFERAFGRYFETVSKTQVKDSKRIIYVLRRKN